MHTDLSDVYMCVCTSSGTGHDNYVEAYTSTFVYKAIFVCVVRACLRRGDLFLMTDN
jgi:hypothetical protein